ncbi:MAG TPA: CapA family protein [Candidatus Limnocylindrales bacterium]|nr:CapA family protein [Candidatus Limnocylindrales bacterium]
MPDPAPWLAITGDVAPMRAVTEFDERLAALLRGAEVAFGNLETPLTARGARAEKAATHRAHPDRIAEVKAFGFDVVTLANNHMLDYGQDGLADTLDVLAKDGVAAVGAGPTRAAAFRAHVRSTRRGGIAFIGICAALPPGYAATEDRGGVAPLRVQQSVAIDPAIQAEQPGGAPFMHTRAVDQDVTEACDAIRAVRASARVVVVALHWGIPHGFAARSYGVLAEYQRPVAHALVDAGADLVVGHHPHVVHPIERYKNGLIAYSLGNYVFHSWGHFARPSHDVMPADATNDPAEQTLMLDMPMAPFRNAFGADEMLESIVLAVDPLADGRGLHVRFIPTLMRAGDPFIPDAARCEDVLRRLTRPALPLWEGGYTPKIEIVRDAELGATVGELRLDAR